MPTEGQALHGSQRGEGFKDTGFVFVARTRIPDLAWQIKLAQMLEAFEFAEFDWTHDGGSEVDGSDMEITGRQLENIADGLAGPFQDQAAFPTEHPLGDFAFGGCRRGN